jgi:tetratricopeptide (TPR) repeat protein
LGGLLAIGAFAANRVVCNRSSYHLVGDFVSNVFQCVPNRAALFLMTEIQAGPFLCSQLVEGARPDVKIVDMSGQVFAEDLGFRHLPGDWRTARWDHFDALYENRPASLAGRPMCALLFEARPTEGKDYEYRRRGLVFELTPRGAPPGPQPSWRAFRFRLPPPEVLAAETTGFELAPLIRDLYAETGIALAEERMRTGALDEALELFRLVLDFEPKATAARAGMAVIHTQRGDAEAVERELRLVLQDEPRSVQALNGLGVVVLGRGNQAEAEAFFRRAAEADPGYPLTWVNLGQALAGDPSRRAEATRSFERFLELAPDDPDAGRVRALLAEWANASRRD